MASTEAIIAETSTACAYEPNAENKANLAKTLANLHEALFWEQKRVYEYREHCARMDVIRSEKR